MAVVVCRRMAQNQTKKRPNNTPVVGPTLKQTHKQQVGFNNMQKDDPLVSFLFSLFLSEKSTTTTKVIKRERNIQKYQQGWTTVVNGGTRNKLNRHNNVSEDTTTMMARPPGKKKRTKQKTKMRKDTWMRGISPVGLALEKKER